MRARPAELTLTSAFAILGGIAAVFVPDPILRSVAVAPLALYCPGYALSRTLIPYPLTKLERITFSLGLNLAIIILLGLGLNFVGGLTRSGWAFALAGFTVATSMLACRSRPQPVPAGRRQLVGPVPVAAIAGAALLAAGGVYVAYTVALAQQQNTAYSQLWILPDANHSKVLVGVRSHETQVADFSLRVTVAGIEFRTWPKIILNPGDSWNEIIELPAGEGPHLLEANLDKSDDHLDPYRHVSMWTYDGRW
jgi:hypothetical protein